MLSSLVSSAILGHQSESAKNVQDDDDVDDDDIEEGEGIFIVDDDDLEISENQKIT
jgi:hypothetical protein